MRWGHHSGLPLRHARGPSFVSDEPVGDFLQTRFPGRMELSMVGCEVRLGEFCRRVEKGTRQNLFQLTRVRKDPSSLETQNQRPEASRRGAAHAALFIRNSVVVRRVINT